MKVIVIERRMQGLTLIAVRMVGHHCQRRRKEMSFISLASTESFNGRLKAQQNKNASTANIGHRKFKCWPILRANVPLSADNVLNPCISTQFDVRLMHCEQVGHGCVPGRTRGTDSSTSSGRSEKKLEIVSNSDSLACCWRRVFTVKMTCESVLV